MNSEKITYRECLQIYQVEASFLEQLESSGLIEVIIEENNKYIDHEHLQHIEQFIRWYYDLEINIEGIEALYHMLQQVQHLQDDIERLKGELNFYKSIL